MLTCIRPTNTPEPEPECSGEEYVIKAGDTCQSVSAANNVATAWMLYDNGLKAFCSGFPSEGESICIVNTCDTYTIKDDDTCQSIASASNITMVQLYTCTSLLF